MSLRDKFSGGMSRLQPTSAPQLRTSFPGRCRRTHVMAQNDVETGGPGEGARSLTVPSTLHRQPSTLNRPHAPDFTSTHISVHCSRCSAVRFGVKLVFSR